MQQRVSQRGQISCLVPWQEIFKHIFACIKWCAFSGSTAGRMVIIGSENEKCSVNSTLATHPGGANINTGAIVFFM